jgi:hypothetical protein
MEDIFEEWDIYAKKKELRNRKVDFNSIEKNSKIKIIAITGIRRLGKSSILILLRQKLNKENKKSAYINLEDSRIKNNPQVLDNILKWFGENGFLLLDEITNINDWEGWLSRNHEMLKGKLNLIVSSSRKSLVIPNKPLRGRILSYEFYPLDFKEFLDFNSIKIEKTTAGIGRIEKALEKYILYGGFPEVVLSQDNTDKIKILNSYFKDIIGLDVAELLKEDLTTVEIFSKYVIESTHFSASKCLNFMKTLGLRISKQSLLNLEKFSQMSYLLFFVPIFSNKIKDRAQYPRKCYVGDTGLINAISGKKDFGKLYENTVLLELKRKIKENQEINYWKNIKQEEVDFIIREGLKVKEVIQVAYELNEEKTKQRELKSLILCAKEFNLKEATLINKEIEDKKTIEGIKINFIPLWKWLLR